MHWREREFTKIWRSRPVQAARSGRARAHAAFHKSAKNGRKTSQIRGPQTTAHNDQMYKSAEEEGRRKTSESVFLCLIFLKRKLNKFFGPELSGTALVVQMAVMAAAAGMRFGSDRDGANRGSSLLTRS